MTYNVYPIANGATTAPNMGSEYNGGTVTFSFFDAGGAPVIPVGVPRVFRSVGLIEREVYQFAKNEWRFNGPANRVRIDLTGLTGYTTYSASVWRSSDPVDMIPDGAYSGLRALLSQGYNEANVKVGLQFYSRMAWPTADPIAAGTPRKILFTTGAKPVLFKGRVFDYVSEEMTLELFENPTGVSGGDPMTIRNFNRRNPVATTVTVTKNVTATGNGTPIDDIEYFYGSAGAPQRAAASIPSGRERVLKENTQHLIVISGAGRAQYMGDWYEGNPDLPLAL